MRIPKNSMIQAAVLSALLLPAAAHAAAPPQDDAPPADVADVPSRDLRVGKNEQQRYFLIGAEEEAEAPKKGFKLLLVLPGGDGGAAQNSFVRRIWKHALGEDYIVAQLVAPRWTEDQIDGVIWPTAMIRWKKMKFTTEEFMDAVIEDVQERHEVNPEHVYSLAWSSSGPAAYSYSLGKKPRVTGTFVAMSVFKPDTLPSLKNAKGHAYYILHSPEDFIPIAQAERARDELAERKAETKLATYPGGHGWRGDVYGNIRDGLAWLDRKHAKPRRTRR